MKNLKILNPMSKLGLTILQVMAFIISKDFDDKTKAKTEVKKDVKTEVKPEDKTEVKTEVKAEVKAKNFEMCEQAGIDFITSKDY